MAVSTKVLVVALAALVVSLAMQEVVPKAAAVQSSSSSPSSSSGSSVVARPGEAIAEQQQRILNVGGGGGGILGLQAVVQHVLEKLKSAGEALSSAVAKAGQDAKERVQAVVDGWNKKLEGNLEKITGFRKKLLLCRKQFPGLGTLRATLADEVRNCVANASAAAAAALKELGELSGKATKLHEDAWKRVKACKALGLVLEAACVAREMAGLQARRALLAGEAAALSARVTGRLTVRIPAQTAACAAAAIGKRTSAVTAHITDLRKCVEGQAAGRADAESRMSGSGRSGSANKKANDDDASLRGAAVKGAGLARARREVASGRLFWPVLTRTSTPAASPETDPKLVLETRAESSRQPVHEIPPAAGG